MPATVVLAHTSITSHDSHFLLVQRALKIHSLGNFQAYSAALLTKITIRSPHLPVLLMKISLKVVIVLPSYIVLICTLIKWSNFLWLSYNRCNKLLGVEVSPEGSLTQRSPTGFLSSWLHFPLGSSYPAPHHPIHPHPHWPMVILIRPRILLRSGLSKRFL